jgi:pyridoxamine 5'-phosphate oxidase
MINIDNINITERPYIIFRELYLKTLSCSQKNIDAIVVSSFDSSTNLVDSRFVNLKSINDEDWVFFTNLESPKANQFRSFDQISVLLFWSSTNIQIRVRAKIKKTNSNLDSIHFQTRTKEKNALARSSSQSNPIDSYKSIKENFKKSLESNDVMECPDYWGGYSFTPYYFEFWEGHTSRLNKRDVYERDGEIWKNYILQP